MNLTFACPNCDLTSRVDIGADVGTEAIVCSHCQQQIQVPDGALEGRRLHRCMVCPSTDLYVRKDFPQRLGVGLVVAGIVASSVAWAYSYVYWTFGILFATALVDVVLFWLVGNALMCYRCHAQYRDVEEMDQHGAFSLETHERWRQQKARAEQR